MSDTRHTNCSVLCSVPWAGWHEGLLKSSEPERLPNRLEQPGTFKVLGPIYEIAQCGLADRFIFAVALPDLAEPRSH